MDEKRLLDVQCAELLEEEGTEVRCENKGVVGREGIWYCRNHMPPGSLGPEQYLARDAFMLLKHLLYDDKETPCMRPNSRAAIESLFRGLEEQKYTQVGEDLKILGLM